MDRYVFDGPGSKQELVGKVMEMKSAPKAGFKRIEIQEKGVTRRTVEVDIPIKQAADIERKKSYKFLVDEKPAPAYAGQQPRKMAGYASFDSSEKPKEISANNGRREVKRSDGRDGTNSTRKH
jgi:predicted secreted protein